MSVKCRSLVKMSVEDGASRIIREKDFFFFFCRSYVIHVSYWKLELWYWSVSKTVLVVVMKQTVVFLLDGDTRTGKKWVIFFKLFSSVLFLRFLYLLQVKQLESGKLVRYVQLFNLKIMRNLSFCLELINFAFLSLIIVLFCVQTRQCF